MYVNRVLPIDSFLKPFSKKIIMLKTSKEWSDLVLAEGEIILDPDGWDRRNFHHSFEVELITIDEFKSRLYVSTVMANLIDLEQRIQKCIPSLT